jgi:cysteine desulfurase
MRDRLEAEVLRATPAAVIVGAGAARLPNTSSIALAGHSAETLVIKFDLAGIAVSAGAACSSGKVGQSHVLAAMGLSPEIARSAIRVSLGPETTEKDIAAFVAAWTRICGGASLAA